MIRFIESSGHCFISKSNMLKYTAKATENVLPYKFLRTALYVQSRSGGMKSGAGEDGWCEVMNRREFSSVMSHDGW